MFKTLMLVITIYHGHGEDAWSESIWLGDHTSADCFEMADTIRVGLNSNAKVECEEDLDAL
jgi:hypothetical protein